MSHTQTEPPMALSERIASAPVEQTGKMLEEAWRFIHGGKEHSVQRDRWFTLLSCQAYHDAAMMLIPDGWMITFLSEISLAGGCTCELDNPGTSQEAKSDEGARTLILAIAAAAVKVNESGDG